MTGPFYHVVFFWLKEPENPETRSFFLEVLNTFLDNTPGIMTRHIGSPAATNREVIDSSYTFSLILTFESKETQDAYQEHPAHKVFVEKCAELWDRVQVYDSVVLGGN
ncbi:MAG: Dabb family protein [Bacteroidota bacterium]